MTETPPPPTVAYFSMEVALRDEIPIFSGGLGVLAGDVLRSAADLALPMVAVSVCWRDGYFHQLLDADGRQHDEPVHWVPDDVLERLPNRVTVEVNGREVTVGCLVTRIAGVGGSTVPLYLLDTNVAENTADDRAITDRLYGGDNAHRLEQEAVLGLAGPAMLESLGVAATTFHMNEGHAALLTLHLLEQAAERAGIAVASEALVADVQDRCVFTTHTPVPAGHDAFADTLVTEVLGTRRAEELNALGQLASGELNMTELGMSLSHYVNGVSLRHQAVAQELAPGHRVESVTNGVHLATWVCPSVAELFDRHIPSWRADNALLRYFGGVPTVDVDIAHAAAKSALLDSVEERAGRRLDPAALTIGLARRATPYKQTTLIFSDLERLRAIAERGPVQVVCAGKAHPRDLEGQQLIEAIVAAGAAMKGSVDIVFLPDYGLELAMLLCAGTDLWLNTPIKPYEASGTSGMKAAVNGVPSFSTLDGWWIEGHVEGVTGWGIGTLEDGDDAAALYEALDEAVLPCFYEEHGRYLEVMRNAVALNASFFNTERVVREYAREAYGLTRR